MQKLFRLVFVGLTLPEGEILLVPSLVKMLDGCLQAAVKERAPLGYLTLLRMFFKSCQGSREPLKMLYAECTSRLAPCLTTLLAMLDGPNSGEVCVLAALLSRSAVTWQPLYLAEQEIEALKRWCAW